MNNWYDRIMKVTPNQSSVLPQRMNYFQQAQYIMNAMKNPAEFVKEQFPDVPEDIRNNPDAILSYLMKTRGSMITRDIQRISGTNGRR